MRGYIVRRLPAIVEGYGALNPSLGGHFHTRCSNAMARCITDDPPMQHLGQGRAVACHLHPTDPVTPAALA